jgi:hypothetical protein
VLLADSEDDVRRRASLVHCALHSVTAFRDRVLLTLTAPLRMVSGTFAVTDEGAPLSR